MSKKDIKISILSQIRMVFVFPLVVAAIHITAVFPMIKYIKILLVLQRNILK